MEQMTVTKARILQLSDKLSGLQHGLEEEKSHRMDAIEARLKSFDERLNIQLINEEKKMRGAKDVIDKLDEGLDGERLAREALADSKSKEVQILDSRLQLAIEVEQQSRKESEGRLVKTLEEKSAGVRSDLVKEVRLREEAEARHRIVVQEDFPRLHEAVKRETQAREEIENRVIKKIQEEIMRVQEAIQLEIQEREQTEEVILRMLENVADKVRDELTEEKKEREETEENLLRLLEEVCESFAQSFALQPTSRLAN